MKKYEAKPYRNLTPNEIAKMIFSLAQEFETPKQKKCPYCHSKDFTKTLVEKDAPIHGLRDAYLSGDVTISGNRLFLNVDSYDEGGIVTYKKISFCPICGRRLKK